jgi:uncharacterized protein (DUF302 family)
MPTEESTEQSIEEISVSLPTSMTGAEARVRSALEAEGFGVITEIDVSGILRAKLGVERPALKILGACDPAVANRALEADPSVSLLLPCNVVLSDQGGSVRVSAAEPSALLPGPALAGISAEVSSRLRRAFESLAGD